MPVLPFAEGLLSPKAIIAEGLAPKAYCRGRFTAEVTLDTHNSVMPDPFQEFLGSLERAGRVLFNETLIESRSYESKKL